MGNNRPSVHTALQWSHEMDAATPTRVQAIIRYSFTETLMGGRRTNAVIRASLPRRSDENALVYLMQKYPDRHNIELTEITFYSS